MEETILYFLLGCFFLYPIKFLLAPHCFQNLISLTQKSILEMEENKNIPK